MVVVEMMIDIKPYVKSCYMAPNSKITPVKKSLPFIEAFRGFYAHRVKHVSIYTSPKGKSHFIIKTWCGASFCNGGGGKGQTFFTEHPTRNKPICATCEGRYIGAGNIDDRMINGRKVMYREF